MANKIVVIYKSRYGSTKKYAEWIAESVGADLFEYSLIKADDLIKYDTIVYGGNMHAGKISGKELIIENFDKIRDKNIVVFWVGSEIVNEKAIERVLNHFSENIRSKIKLFGLRGAFNYQKLGLIDKLLMLIMKATLNLKGQKRLTENESGLLSSCDTPVDHIDKNTIEPILGAINKI
jgi:menaquinone-dependent protoporphyrinogen IX oxidase